MMSFLIYLLGAFLTLRRLLKWERATTAAAKAEAKMRGRYYEYDPALFWMVLFGTVFWPITAVVYFANKLYTANSKPFASLRRILARIFIAR